jgi:hypothetical protein
MLPREFPLLLAVQRYFYAWHGSGLWQTINHLNTRNECSFGGAIGCGAA